MSQGPPLKPELMYEDIWANGPATTVISSILGPKPHVNYVNGNTALGGFNGARQNVHADLTFNHGLFPPKFHDSVNAPITQLLIPAYHKLLHVLVMYCAVLTSLARSLALGRSWDWIASWRLKV